MLVGPPVERQGDEPGGRAVDGLASGIGADTTNIPPRFVPALVAGLAYYIAMKKPEAVARILPLKEIYDEQFELAAGEDRDRSSVMFVPFNTMMIGGV